ncbi:hypothetical protein C8R47DRAFT_968662 [Mycena vitilis]|nr:hypothetical protein C8R47DRAFT_968662 [Mycena vitilis]
MSWSGPPFVPHDPKHTHPQKEQPRRAALTSVPDLRFEYGFLKSVRPYFRLRREDSQGKGKGKETDAVAVTPASEPDDTLEIQWLDVVWVATRDQVLSPLVQGALWYVFVVLRCDLSLNIPRAIATYFFTPFYGTARSFIPTPPEGGVAKWLRSWAHKTGAASNNPPASKLYTRP